jgi:hypothetical protein
MTRNWWHEWFSGESTSYRGPTSDFQRQCGRAQRLVLEILESRTLLTFSVLANYPVGSSPQSIATGDFNLDGILDLAVANAGSNTVSVLLGNSDGSFQRAVDFPTGVRPVSVAVGDFNGDGVPDLAVANYDESTVSILLGRGDGTFQPASTTIDFSNGFGNHSNITANGKTTFLGNPPVLRLTDGDFGEASSAWYNTPVAPGPFSTTFTLQDQPVNGAADGVCFVIQGDPSGTAALGGSGGGEGYSGIVNSIAIKFDLWTHGTHNPTTGLFTGGESPAGDPSKDVPLTGINLGSHDPILVTLAYDGTEMLTETVTDTVTGMTFTHSYLLDLAKVIGTNVAYAGFTGGTGGETAIQDIVKWTGSFQGVASQTGLGPVSVAVGDFNNDGILDIVTANSKGNTVSVLLGNGDGTFRTAVNFAAGSQPSSVAVANFRVPTLQDLVVANAGDNTVSVFFGAGDGTFLLAGQYRVGIVPASVAVGDIFHDGFLDLATANAKDDTVSLLRSNGDGTFQMPLNIPVGKAPQFVLLSDVDKDDLGDLVTANFADNTISVLRSTDGVTFTRQDFSTVSGSGAGGPTSLAEIPGTSPGWANVVVINSLDNSATIMENGCDWTAPGGGSGNGNRLATVSLARDAFFQGATNAEQTPLADASLRPAAPTEVPDAPLLAIPPQDNRVQDQSFRPYVHPSPVALVDSTDWLG